jgi:hypothetical protein
MSSLQYALAYAEIGWSVFPVWSCDEQGHCRCPKGQFCKTQGKHPHTLAQHGHLDATTDEHIIKHWFESDPQAGIGVACDSSGLVVLDIDPRNGGYKTLATIEAAHEPLNSNCVADTQGGGEHRIFKADPNITFPSTLGSGLDIKHHGYICVEPTQGSSGKYGWRVDYNPLMGNSPSELPEYIRGQSRSTEKCDRSIGQKYPVATKQTFSDLRDALTHINADEYHTWIKVGLALRPYEEVGYEIWTAWSATSKKFDYKTQRDKWDGDIDYPENITYLSIFAMARDAGWSGIPIHPENDPSTISFEDPDPVNLFETSEPAAIDLDSCLPFVVANWAKVHAAASGLDAVGYAFAALPVLAASTHRDVRINLGRGHNVPVIIWSAIVGATGSGKSPAMSAAHAPLSSMHAIEVLRVQEERRIWSSLKPKDRSPLEPSVRRVRYTADTTPEAMTANLARSDGPRLLLHYDEGSGWLNAMGRYSNGSDGERATYLSSWLGLRNHVVSRVGRGEIFVPELGANILFGITPNKIKEGLQEATAEGLLARTLLCLIKRREQTNSLASEDFELTAADKAYAMLVETLSKVQGNEIFFSVHAQIAFDDLRKHYGDNSVVLESMYPAVAALLAKAAEITGRLAGLFRLCREPENSSLKFSIQPFWTIEIEDLTLAKNLIDVAIDHALSAYTGTLMTDEPTAIARECALKILRLHHADPNTRLVRRDQFMKIAAFKMTDRATQGAAIDLLRTYHWLTADKTQRHREGSGRFNDGTRWLININALDGRFNLYALESVSQAQTALKALRSMERAKK